jgi:hypothetical protein
VSSIRSRSRPSCSSAKRRLATALSALPRCREPVGLGAKRTLTTTRVYGRLRADAYVHTRYRGRMLRGALALVASAIALAAVPLARASFLVARNATDVTLRLAGARAIVDYRLHGRPRHVVLWGAMNARPPSRNRPQVAFRVVYGPGTLNGGTCPRYDGPRLPRLVVACSAPDGSYWALQSWQRLVPNYGGTSGPRELQASHWSGPLPKLQVWLDWSYRRFQHLFGRFTYRGRPVFGFRATPRGAPLDAYARNVYLDTFDSRYGQGWRRENGFLTRGPTGSFCYGFYPHGSRPSGAGTAYRITVRGPGVTPIVSWQAKALGTFDPGLDSRMYALERSLGDPKCRRA